ncbi:response regulator [Anthocerotibacter panamensis]|uniref:response regulator n=1 Tax=Anthocerotibacter panamensis TaxID=2857077 RepID=UPI001C40614A|nr:response regulator [Anthocerotibacter panamensis]
MRIRILFVDDDPAQRYLVGSCLTDAGYEVATVTTAGEALEILARFVPDLMITDINLPKVSGFELARAIQDSEQAGQFPIIFLSGQNTLENRVQSYDIGGDYFIAKPWSSEELIAVIASSLRRNRVTRETTTLV